MFFLKNRIYEKMRMEDRGKRPMEMNPSDIVRAFARARYVIPQVESGKVQFPIRIREIWKDLKSEGFPVAGRTPLICKALTGPKFLRENGLEIESIEGPPSKMSPTVVVRYRIARQNPSILVSSAAGNATGRFASPGESSQESPADRAFRLTEKLRGILKEQLAEYGGAEGFMRWVRSEDEGAA